MPIPNYMQPEYFGAMDQSNYFVAMDQFAPIYSPGNVASDGIQTGLGPTELGITNNPMQHQLQALQAKIKEGASKIEFEFMGAQKGNSQQATPESYGKEEREMMRHLANINNMKTSTHATPSVSGLAGFDPRQGFSNQHRDQTIFEVERAIDFAKDATTGGAIVVHTGEWTRPISTQYGQGADKWNFSQFPDEDKDAQMLVVDRETGELIQGISKNRKIFAPKWETAETWQDKIDEPLVGKPAYDVFGKSLGRDVRPDDFVDQNGRVIDERKVNQLFKRVPVYDEKEVKFEVDTIDWEGLVAMKDRYNQKWGVSLSPEEFYAKMQIDNNVLQSKGQSLFYLQRYQDDRDSWERVKTALEYYEQLDKSLSDEEKWQIMMQKPEMRGFERLLPPQNVNIAEYLKEQKESLELSMRHVHEASSAADARAEEMMARRDRIDTIEDYGLKQTAKSLAHLGRKAIEATRRAREQRPNDKFDDLYIAPENWHPAQYGSHPDELLRIVQEGRKQLVQELKHYEKLDDKKAEELARKSIKTTFDIGHLNMWRRMMEKKEGESEEKFQARFNDWVFTHLDKLHKEGAIGHLHLTDNFGFHDEHLSLGQGNAPVKQFVEWAKKRNYTDFIIEPGSFNPHNIMQDAWAYLGAVNWKKGGPGFSQQHMSHAGFYAPPNYIVGAYVPSNEWTLWTGVPLE